jgi:hypothetical protein
MINKYIYFILNKTNKLIIFTFILISLYFCLNYLLDINIWNTIECQPSKSKGVIDTINNASDTVNKATDTLNKVADKTENIVDKVTNTVAGVTGATLAYNIVKTTNLPVTTKMLTIAAGGGSGILINNTANAMNNVINKYKDNNETGHPSSPSQDGSTSQFIPSINEYIDINKILGLDYNNDILILIHNSYLLSLIINFLLYLLIINLILRYLSTNQKLLNWIDEYIPSKYNKIKYFLFKTIKYNNMSTIILILILILIFNIFNTYVLYYLYSNFDIVIDYILKNPHK